MRLHIILTILLLQLGVQLGYSQTYLIQAKPAEGDDWGYINLKGDFVIPATYKKVFEFSEDGYALILEKKSKQYEFINTKGEKIKPEVSEFKLKEIFGFNVQGFNSGMLLIKVGDKWGYLNSQGKEVVKPSYEKAAEFHEGYATAQKGGKNYIIDRTGKETEVTDSKIAFVKNFSEKLAPFESTDKKEGFIDATGKIVIEPKYKSVGYFTNGLAWAKLADGKLGYINPKGDWVIEPQFSVAKNFDAKSGLARVKAGEQWQYVDKSGKATKLNDAETFEDFSDGVSVGKKGGKAGAYDNTGKWVIEPKFEDIRDFKNGYAAARQDKKWGIISKTGEWVVNPTFGDIKEVVAVK